MDVDQRVAYKKCILRGTALKNYKAVLVECMQLAKDLAGDSWYLGALKYLYRDDFWTWAKKDIIGFDRDAYLG